MHKCTHAHLLYTHIHYVYICRKQTPPTHTACMHMRQQGCTHMQTNTWYTSANKCTAVAAAIVIKSPTYIFTQLLPILCKNLLKHPNSTPIDTSSCLHTHAYTHTHMHVHTLLASSAILRAPHQMGYVVNDVVIVVLLNGYGKFDDWDCLESVNLINRTQCNDSTLKCILLHTLYTQLVQ